MTFNSFEFIFLFLPFTWAVYTLLIRRTSIIMAQGWLVACNLFFYGYCNPLILPFLLVSIVVNYLTGRALCAGPGTVKRLPRGVMLGVGLAFNIVYLGYFKYANFFILNINTISGAELNPLQILLPLGISFFTFQQISFLVDTYRGKVEEKSFLSYLLFVSFFPYISSGPITRHGEIMPQHAETRNRSIDHANVSAGILLFSIGLFKKTMIADNLALWANQGFDAARSLDLFEAWFTSLSFTFQLYFDFSGYTDMAIGAALLFNLKLPINFDSPYKSLSIQEFWRRWHITLSRFLRDYIYIPLGGNRASEFRVCFNIIITFLIGGIWHGAGWTFVLWGIAHGIALVIQRLWNKTGIKLNHFLKWFITFNFVNAAWVLFRARGLDDAIKVYSGMIGLNGVMLSDKLAGSAMLRWLGIEFVKWPVNISKNLYYIIYLLVAAAIISFCAKNSQYLVERFRPNWKWFLFTVLLLGMGLVHTTRISNFLYVNF
ncbi:MAG: MBOAT family protein [Chrysiogenales bacterium]|nr:MAG: MBOAT family protein [Chrysiogenales bacterium]